MMDISIKIDGVDISGVSGGRKTAKMLSKQMNIRKEVAECMAGMIAVAFDDLLLNAPQYTGNFVANMAVRAGAYGGNKGGVEYFPHKQNIQDVFIRGNMAAVYIARKENPNIVKNLTAHIKKSSGWLQEVTIYNRFEDSEIVESLEAGELRDGNKEGAHAMAQAAAQMQSLANKTIIYDSPEFHAFRAKS